MKAVVVTGEPSARRLEVRELHTPAIDPDDVLVDVYAAGLNRADLSNVRTATGRNHASYRPGVPGPGRQAQAPQSSDFIMGYEFAGVVRQRGSAVTRFQPGDRVMGMCQGGYTQELAIDNRLCIPVPSHLSWPEAAAVPTVGITAHDALVTHGRFRAGESVLIHGVGSGVGTAALAIARALGAGRTFGTSRDRDKLARAAKLGLDRPIHTPSEDFAAVIAAETGDAGVDVIIDNVGAPYFDGSVAALALGGRLVSVGRTGGKVSSIDLDMLARKRLSLIGVTFRTRNFAQRVDATARFTADVLEHIASGAIRPVVDRTFPLEEVAAAHAYMELDQHFGKIILLCR